MVDPVPPTNHRVITTVLYDATMPREVKNRPGAPGSQPGDYSERLLAQCGSVELAAEMKPHGTACPTPVATGIPSPPRFEKCFQQLCALFRQNIRRDFQAMV